MSSIVFKTIRWKNFLSTGDNWVEVDLAKSSKTLIVGANGAGKSTLLDALSYVLFNKAHRNINKPQLVNTINEKNLRVEIEFEIGKNKYVVTRGQKPIVFEIYKNGEMFNQDSKARDYQQFLEQTILKFNYKSFHQVVVLGSSSFIPFMQLPAAQRREIIENLLDINVFSKMNVLLREQNSSIKEEYRDVETNLKILKERIRVAKQYIQDLQNINEDLVKEKQSEVVTLALEYDQVEEKSATLENKLLGVDDEYKDRLKSLKSNLKQLEDKDRHHLHNIKSSKKIVKFFQENDTCPTCTQEVDTNLSESKITHNQEYIDVEDAKHYEVQQAIERLNEKMDELDNTYEKITKDKRRLDQYRNDMNAISKRISSLNKDIATLYEKTGDVEENENDLKAMIDEKESLEAQRSELGEKLNYNTLKFEMLKDNGIKTKIIRKYRPVINQLINQYLQVLDFFVQFTLDENFKEVIKSRYRDIFSYSSFSEGEKARIDLALLFTWRQIAAMKNSMKTNLLILDETFDSSLDTDGVDNLLKILDTLEDRTNVFVISHKRDILDTKFPNKLVFEKVNNFTAVREE